jgi:hypothetical protein
MIQIRRSQERGHANHGWLDSYHTFSFADYHDPQHMGFRALRVINEDRVAPGRGFGTHGHKDMEIISYVISGALEHRDSMGNGSVMKPGDVQRMSAGTGVMHSEFNASKTEPVHFLQIWILPEKEGATPGYEQKHFSDEDKKGRFRVIASRDGRDGSVTVFQDAIVSARILEPSEHEQYVLGNDRHAFVHIVSGEVELGGKTLRSGDASTLISEPIIPLKAQQKSEIIIFDLG